MMKQGTSTGYVWVTVEADREPPRIVRWRGSSAKRIRAKARAHYPKGTRLSFGHIIYVNSYGAH